MRWHHNSYSEEALAEMQKEAENRVRQMQSRARLVGDYSPPEKQNFQIKPPAPIPKSNLPLNSDNDSLIILALLWLLWNEHADSKLLLALLYILLQ